MLYVVQHGGNFVQKATNRNDLVYIACRLNDLVESGKTLFFSDGHATNHLTSFYDSSMIDKVGSILDWDAIKSEYWGGEDNLNVKRKKQAEMLVFEDIEPELITVFYCYNDEVLHKLKLMGAKKVRTAHNAFY